MSGDAVDTDAVERDKSRPDNDATTDAGACASLSQQQHATALRGAEQHDRSVSTLSSQQVWQH